MRALRRPRIDPGQERAGSCKSSPRHGFRLRRSYRPTHSGVRASTISHELVESNVLLRLVAATEPSRNAARRAKIFPQPDSRSEAVSAPMKKADWSVRIRLEPSESERNSMVHRVVEWWRGRRAWRRR